MLLFIFAFGVVVAVAVAIAVAVAVAVGVAVARFGEGCAVEDYGHVAVFLFFVDALELGEHFALEEAGADDEDGAVNVGVDDLGIGHDFDGRAVNEDVVEVGTELVEHIAEAV